MPIIAIILLTFFSILLQVASYVYDAESKQKEKKLGRKKKREASRRRIRCFHPLINGFLKQSTSEEPADQ